MAFNSDKYLINLYYDENIIFKKKSESEQELVISPIRVKDYFSFFTIIDIFTIEKNRIPDVKIISMSYMDFILSKIEKETNNINFMISRGEDIKEINQEHYMTYLKFYEILKLCMNVDYNDIRFSKNEKGKYTLYLKGFEINKKDFDEIRGIICEQNLVEIPDEKIDPKLKEVLDEAVKFKNKNNAKMGSLEDQMICLMSEYHYDIDKIKNLTLRKFQKMLERADYKLHYQIYKNAEMSGIQFKGKIDHWMSEIIKDKYADVISKYDDTMNKFK